MITIHHRATFRSLNNRCGLIETNQRFSFPPLSCSGSRSLGCTEAAPPRRWRWGHDAAWGWMVARQARRGFQQGNGWRATCFFTPSFPKNTVFTCRADRQSQCFPAGKVTRLTCVNLTQAWLVYAWWAFVTGLEILLLMLAFGNTVNSVVFLWPTPDTYLLGHTCRMH